MDPANPKPSMKRRLMIAGSGGALAALIAVGAATMTGGPASAGGSSQWGDVDGGIAYSGTAFAGDFCADGFCWSSLNDLAEFDTSSCATGQVPYRINSDNWGCRTEWNASGDGGLFYNGNGSVTGNFTAQCFCFGVDGGCQCSPGGGTGPAGAGLDGVYDGGVALSGLTLRTGQNLLPANLLLHFDGTGVFVDSSASAHSLLSAGATQTSAQAKWGNSALFANIAPAYVYTGASSDFEVGESDWTIDFWSWSNDISAGAHMLFDLAETVMVSQDGGALKLWAANSSCGWYINGSVFGSISANQWYHIAFTRTGRGTAGVITGYINGVATQTWPMWPGGVICRTHDIVSVGGRNSGNWTANGYIDEFRFINGVAAWTGNFTPPAAPYAPAPYPAITFRDGTIQKSAANLPDFCPNGSAIAYNGDAGVWGCSP